MERSSDYSKLPNAYKEACRNPEVIVLGCHHLKDLHLCPGTCCLAKQESGRLETVAQTK